MMLLSKEFKKKGLFIIGIIIGLIHFKAGLKAMFVMTGEEHVLLLLFILLGPILTLPAVMMSYFKPRAGGILLILGGTVSLIIMVIFAVETVYFEKISFYVIRYFIPMIMLGCGALYLNKSKK